MSSPDYLNVYLLPQSCALEYDDTPFEPGEFGDLPSRDGEFFVEVLVGETVAGSPTPLPELFCQTSAATLPVGSDRTEGARPASSVAGHGADPAQ